ncbi:unnamed protein product [Brassica oleracea]
MLSLNLAQPYNKSSNTNTMELRQQLKQHHTPTQNNNSNRNSTRTMDS